MERATPHGLRRTHGTTVTSLGFTREQMNRIQNHKEGGITQIYDRFSYDGPKRNALDAWAARLQEIVAGTPAPEKVVALERA